MLDCIKTYEPEVNNMTGTEGHETKILSKTYMKVDFKNSKYMWTLRYLVLNGCYTNGYNQRIMHSFLQILDRLGNYVNDVWKQEWLKLIILMEKQLTRRDGWTYRLADCRKSHEKLTDILLEEKFPI